MGGPEKEIVLDGTFDLSRGISNQAIRDGHMAVSFLVVSSGSMNPSSGSEVEFGFILVLLYFLPNETRFAKRR
jgi:hypothetical protein